jgi:hypothetical protein
MVPGGSARNAAKSSSMKAASELEKERLIDNGGTSDLEPAWSRETAESRLRGSEDCRRRLLLLTVPRAAAAMLLLIS